MSDEQEIVQYPKVLYSDGIAPTSDPEAAPTTADPKGGVKIGPNASITVNSKKEEKAANKEGFFEAGSKK
jgi:hypothetical protein